MKCVPPEVCTYSGQLYIVNLQSLKWLHWPRGVFLQSLNSLAWVVLAVALIKPSAPWLVRASKPSKTVSRFTITARLPSRAPQNNTGAADSNPGCPPGKMSPSKSTVQPPHHYASPWRVGPALWKPSCHKSPTVTRFTYRGFSLICAPSGLPHVLYVYMAFFTSLQAPDLNSIAYRPTAWIQQDIPGLQAMTRCPGRADPSPGTPLRDSWEVRPHPHVPPLLTVCNLSWAVL